MKATRRAYCFPQGPSASQGMLDCHKATQPPLHSLHTPLHTHPDGVGDMCRQDIALQCCLPLNA